ncbi:MAG: glycoside hydrolase family 43 protein, partial [Parasporobacterium sp.]|nr:glycoside hydrolase family 43 protein [Parasporobacterium sp.]
GYLYVYFKKLKLTRDDQRIYFALSRDGLHFQEINQGRPVLVSDMGTKGLRDPHIFKSRIDGKYYLLATDLDCNSNKWKDFSTKGSKDIFVAESENLIHWKSEMVNVCGSDIGCVWAPKVCFDEEKQQYVLFFSGSEPERVCMKVYYTVTTDFKSFSKPGILIDKYENKEKKKYRYSPWPFAPKYITHIDSTTIYVDGIYYRFTKNESLKIIQEEYSKSICSGFKLITDCVAGEAGVEGPGVYKLFDSDTYVLMMDGYIKPNTGVGYFPLTASTEELKQGKFHRLQSGEYAFPSCCKHGSIITIDEEAYNNLKKMSS